MDFGRYAKKVLIDMIDKLPNDKQKRFRQKDDQHDYPFMIGNKVTWRKYRNWIEVAWNTKDWLKIVTRYLKTTTSFN